MKKFNVLMIIILTFMVAAAAAANLFISAGNKNSDMGRPYRVEINRIQNEISGSGLSSLDLSEYKYVSSVSKYDRISDAIDSESDYVICEINGELYRIEYSYTEKSNAATYIIVNSVFAAVFIFVTVMLIYIKNKIIKPFYLVSTLPYELSKGNLTMPVKNENGPYFGKFVWGMELLRSNMEQQKARELELQKEKKTMLLSLSHDIKTPLSAIKLYSKAISTGLYDGKKTQSEIAGSINQKADEIECYISEIIKTANEDLFKYDITISTFYLSKLIDEIKKYYSEKLELVHTEFIVEPYTDCLLSGDFDRGVEVIQNLMENAIKYGDGVRIKIDFSTEDGCQLVSVTNTGAALAENELPRIFDSFYRGSNSDGKSGSGLGLYICRQLMNKMNGEVFATQSESELTVTAVFSKA